MFIAWNTILLEIVEMTNEEEKKDGKGRSRKPESEEAKFLSRLESEPALAKALNLTPTYTKRFAAALQDPDMRWYLEVSLTSLNVNWSSDAEAVPAAAVEINRRLVEKAKWDAKNPGRPFIVKGKGKP